MNFNEIVCMRHQLNELGFVEYHLLTHIRLKIISYTNEYTEIDGIFLESLSENFEICSRLLEKNAIAY